MIDRQVITNVNRTTASLMNSCSRNCCCVRIKFIVNSSRMSMTTSIMRPKRKSIRLQSSLLRDIRSFSSTATPMPFTTTISTTTNTSSNFMMGGGGEKLRVAIVGGGCAGLATALQLAPLVDVYGYIAGPIDIYIDKPIPNRSIGVGIWSTAIQSFLYSNRTSHQEVYQSMTSNGTWLDKVGYRTPDGTWLLHSQLPSHDVMSKYNNSGISTIDDSTMNIPPALLFLREKDMMQSLQEAVHWEEQYQGTIRVHNISGQRVIGVYEESNQPWSTNIMLSNNSNTNNNNSNNNNSATTLPPITPMEQESDHMIDPSLTNPTTTISSPSVSISDRDYHLIVAADGMHSTLRRIYGGYESNAPRLMGTSALPSPNDLPIQSHPTIITDPNYISTLREEIIGLQDRHYTVFRGNANISRSELYNDPNHPSYQTWGVGNSMRFATVPMLCPTPHGRREEKQVWFMTIDNDDIIQESDPIKRRDMLLHAFRDWHDPIQQTVLATPPDEIIMERAIAHRHCTGPVLDLNSKVIPNIRLGRRPPSSGDGPCIVFVGDSYMTVDPILAQGFTMAMESGAALRQSITHCYEQQQRNVVSNISHNVNTNTAPVSINITDNAPVLSFDPIQLRYELKKRQVKKMDRLICLLRVTEFVQALGQPSTTTTWTGSRIWNTMILRPILRIIPNWIKAPIFDMVLKYSLGLGFFRNNDNNNKVQKSKSQ